MNGSPVDTWQALYWKVPGYKRGPGRPRTNWRSTVNKDLQKMGLSWEEAEVADLDRHGWCWSVVTVMWDESRSRSRILNKLRLKQ